MNDPSIAVFGEGQIRGSAWSDSSAHELGRAVGTYLVRDGRSKMTLGRDSAEQSARLYRALTNGLLSTGMHVLDVGVVTTPVLEYSVGYFDADGGVQINAGPAADSVFLIFRGQSQLDDVEIHKLRALFEQGDYEAQIGQLETKDANRPYSAMDRSTADR